MCIYIYMCVYIHIYIYSIHREIDIHAYTYASRKSPLHRAGDINTFRSVLFIEYEIQNKEGDSK